MSSTAQSGAEAIDLRLGRWQDVLADVQCDALITDTPYSQRTEDGFRTSADINKRGLGYDPIDEDWVCDFVSSWHPRTTGWLVMCCDHISARWIESAMEACGRYVFPPLPIVKTGAAPRMSCDGPASQSEWMMVSRPKQKRFLSWGSLRGWYSMETVRAGRGHLGVSGAKSLDFMRAIIRDYSKPGDMVCDPCAGGGTTLLAAAMENRKAIGAEMDPKHYEIARKRIAKGYTPSLLTVEREPAEQLALGDK